MDNLALIRYKFICTVCGKVFSRKTHLNRHMKNVHDCIVAVQKPNLKCPICLENLKTYAEIDTHLTTVHDISVEHRIIEFDSRDAFNTWKQEIEGSSQSSYVFFNSGRRNEEKVTKYICHRSGHFKPNLQKSVRQREIKVTGSNKIGCSCPARIILKEKKMEQVIIDYVPTHIGHEKDVGRLRLTNTERTEIARTKVIQSRRIAVEKMQSIITSISQCDNLEAISFASEVATSLLSDIQAIQNHSTTSSMIPINKVAHNKRAVNQQLWLPCFKKSRKMKAAKANFDSEEPGIVNL